MAGKKYKKYKVHPAVYRKPGEPASRDFLGEQRLFRAQVFVVASFLTLLFVVGLLSLFLPKPTESEYERRTLATMPEFSAQDLFWGDYLRDVEMFYADTFPMRDQFVQLASVVDEARGIRVGGVRIIEGSSMQEAQEEVPAEPEPSQPVSPEIIEADEPEPETAEEEEEELTPYEVEDDGAEGEQTDEGFFIYKDRVMAIFGGNKELGTYYAETLNAYAEALGPDVTVYDMVIPTAIEFGLPERYKSVSNSEKNAIDHIYEQLEGVVPVDAYTQLSYHAGEYVYFNTDHHWTGLGAYYAYVAFCEAAGLEPLDLEEYELRSLDEEFLGTLYSQTNDSAVKDNPDRVDYYITPGEFDVTRYERSSPSTPIDSTVWAEYATGANCYAVFLHGDFPLVEIKTDVGNGRKAVLVKESFGNAFAPFLLSHYEEVYVVDHRYFNQGLVSFIEENEIDDLIFLKNVFAANTKFHIEYIEEMMY